MMERNLGFLFSASILAFSFPILVGVHLSKTELQRVLHFSNTESIVRFKRQLIIDPQPFIPPIANRVLQVPIPTNIAFFPGAAQPPDQQCDRDETLMADGSCQNLLTNGNCDPQEEVLLDPETNRGFCAPRICPPDRVFIPLTQLCHDPRDTTVCPPGRELYYSAYGTAVCSCPDGTVEGDDDLDDDVCEPLLGTTLQCTPGMYEYESMSVSYNQPAFTKYDGIQKPLSSYSANSYDPTPKVFWFKDFNSPPQCLPDPCNGTNLKRGPNDLPFVPNKEGKCFQLGQTTEACTYGNIYVLNLENLKGECTTLEDAGYNIFDPKVLQELKKMFGPTITENTGPPLQMTTYGSSSQSYGMYGPYNNAVTAGINSIDQNLQQSNTNKPLSSYQTLAPTNLQTIKSNINNIQETQNSINAFLSDFISPFDQTKNVGKITHSTQVTPTKQNHHQVVLGSNGISTHKTEILPAINLTNLFHNIHQSGILSSLGLQNNHKVQSISPNAFISQSTITPLIQTNSLNPLTQLNQGNLIYQNTQIPFTSINSQKPFLSNPVTKPSEINVGNYSPNVLNSNLKNGENDRISGFTSTSNSVSHVQKSNQATQGKEICTFVQNPNGQGGKKVCHFTDGGIGQQPFNSLEVHGTQIGFNSPEILPGGQAPLPSVEMINARAFESYGYRFGRSLGFKHPPQFGLLTHHITVFPTGKIVTHLQPLTRHRREAEGPDIEQLDSLQINDKTEALEKVHSRRKRTPLPHASPSNVFETRLLSCRSGAARDVNGKCRNKIIPARVPQRRGIRAAPPVQPTPTCPTGMAFNIRRMCVPSTTAQNSLVAFNLG